jgi:hypothetical protein
MLSITHLVVSLLLIQLLNLDRNDAFIALVFGVFIDLDHLFGLKQYTEARGIAALLDFDSLMNPGGQWKSMFHSPVAVGVVAPLSVGSRLAIPILFWGVHLAMDFAEDTFLGLFSAPEAMLLALAGIALVSMRYAKCLESGTTTGILGYLRSEASSIRGAFGPSIW